MIFKFSLVSDEVADYRREIQIDGDDTFLDLHRAIMECSGYDQAKMASFFMCDDWWGRKQEISLVELDTDSDVDVFVMEEETLSDWFDEEKQKLMFVFDYSGDRGFYMELSEMIMGEYLSTPICTKKQGVAPVQFLKEVEETEPEIPAIIAPPVPLLGDEGDEDEDDDEDDADADDADADDALLGDESFYGSDSFNADELDAEGFEGLDMPDAEMDSEEETDLL